MKKVLIIDTSILCVWLNVPGMETCGPDNDRWDLTRVDTKIQQELRNKTTFVLPLATIIETGNHISQCNGDRFDVATDLCKIIEMTINETEPWAAFSAQTEELWSGGKVMELVRKWPKLAAEKISIGDATIKDVAEYYYQSRNEVEIFTGDQGLKAYEPAPRPVHTSPPRRRK